MGRVKRYSLLVAAVLTPLAVVSAVATADRDESNPPGADVSQIVVIEPDARAALSVLDEARTPGDALPDDVTHAMNVHADFGMNPDLSRLSIANATHSVYVVPARGYVCASLTVGEGANITCPSLPDVAAGKAGPATVGLAGSDIAIYGLVPDGVGSVSVHTGVADSMVTSTQGNAYYTVVPAGTPLRTVSYVGPSGSVEFPIYDPTAEFESP